MSDLPIRESINKKYRWRLEDIYESFAAWEADFIRAAEAVTLVTADEDTLHTPGALINALKRRFERYEIVERLFVYARMGRDQDNVSDAYQGLVQRAEALITQLSGAYAYMEPEILRQSTSVIDAALSEKDAAPFDAYIEDVLRKQPHTLSAEGERLVALTGDVLSGPDTAYSMLIDADLRFPTIKDDHEGNVRLSHGVFYNLMRSHNRDLRRRAFRAYYAAFKAYENTIPALYASSLKGDVFIARAGKFDTPLEAALFPNRVPVDLYDSLIEAVRRALPTLQKYIRTRGAILGLHDVHMYDLYAPLVKDFELNLPYEDAYKLVCAAMAPLGDKYVKTLKEAYSSGWIDVIETRGKTSGAYSWGAYGSHPYVLLNYHESMEEIFTIAHEMGHAMHTHLSNAAQPYPKASYSLFVAEVASTVNEVLLNEHLLKTYTQPEARTCFINNLLDQFRTTVFRQTQFAAFERATHDWAMAGEAVTGARMNEMYAQINAEWYAACAQDKPIAWEWMRIPHFYRAFYVYQYATGFSAAVAIARGIIENGEPAAKRYREFLSLGGSLPPIEALKVAGVNMTTAAPIDAALKYFGQLVDDFAIMTGGRNA